MATLHERVQKLPPELFNEIKDIVFSSTANRVMIDESYTPPTTLHVSNETRKQFAEMFYGSGTTFVFCQPSAFQRWLKSLGHEHLQMIQAIEIQIRLPRYSDGPLVFEDALDLFSPFNHVSLFFHTLNRSVLPHLLHELGIKTLHDIISFSLVDSEHVASFSVWS